MNQNRNFNIALAALSVTSTLLPTEPELDPVAEFLAPKEVKVEDILPVAEPVVEVVEAPAPEVSVEVVESNESPEDRKKRLKRERDKRYREKQKLTKRQAA